MFASQIDFTYTGRGTGLFNGTSFTDAPFTAVFIGNSTLEAPIGDGFWLPVNGTISVNGFGLATLTNPQKVEYGPPSTSVPLPYGELWVTSDDKGILISFPGDWNGTDSLGPVVFIPFFGTVSWATNLGDVELTSISSTMFGPSYGVLTVTDTPEPSALAMFIVGLAWLGACRFHRRKV